jgi:hypothetical protein
MLLTPYKLVRHMALQYNTWHCSIMPDPKHGTRHYTPVPCVILVPLHNQLGCLSIFLRSKKWCTWFCGEHGVHGSLAVPLGDDRVASEFRQAGGVQHSHLNAVQCSAVYSAASSAVFSAVSSAVSSAECSLQCSRCAMQRAACSVQCAVCSVQ